MEDLALEQLIVIYPGDKTYALAERVLAMPLHEAIANPF